ncbi:MAG: Fe-S cluster assembly ATPase SufC [bacterium]
MLEIKNLKVNRTRKNILNGINLSIKGGETHILMGPNGSGKSTLANALMGNPSYEVFDGEILLDGKSLLNLSPNKRASAGLFLAFQYPVEIEGVPMKSFLRTVLKELEKPLENFEEELRKNLELLKIGKDIIERSLNFGFSGGERKKSEILQLALFSPKYAILDETDSGLDISALRTVAEGITVIKKRNPKLGVLIITHNPKILKYIKVDGVHLMLKGKIVRSGDIKLVKEVEKRGYYKL